MLNQTGKSLSALIVVVLMGQNLFAQTPIASLDELQAISGDLSGDYVLVADIDASPTQTWNSGAGFVPIGSSTTPFVGTFDGGGFVISNLSIMRPDAHEVGLFGYVGSGGSLLNVVIVDADIVGGVSGGGARGSAGALAGVVNAGVVKDCSATGSITLSDGGEFGGGLIGWLDVADCERSYFSGAVSADGSSSWVGGLVGYALSCKITRCYSEGSSDVDASSCQAGGLVGQLNNRLDARNALIETSFSHSTVGGNGGGSYGGGLVGNMGRFTMIDRCYADGDVYGSSFAGGLCGVLDGAATDSYSQSAVAGGEFSGIIGGLAGMIMNLPGSATRCYSTGLLTPADGNTIFGGLIGNSQNPAGVVDSFFDQTTAGTTTSAGGTPIVTAVAQLSSTYSAAGWSITNGTTTAATWSVYLDNYPTLSAAQQLSLSATVYYPTLDNDIGELTGIGPYADNFIFELIAGSGSDHNALFVIDGTTLKAVDGSTLSNGDYFIRIGGYPAPQIARAEYAFQANFVITVATPPSASHGIAMK